MLATILGVHTQQTQWGSRGLHCQRHPLPFMAPPDPPLAGPICAPPPPTPPPQAPHLSKTQGPRQTPGNPQGWSSDVSPRPRCP